MTKEKAIEYIRGITSGKFGPDMERYPDRMKGRIAEILWSDLYFSYGFEYGEINGLMMAFDLTEDDIFFLN